MFKGRLTFLLILGIAFSQGASASLISLHFTANGFVPLTTVSNDVEYTSKEPAPFGEVKGHFIWEGESISDAPGKFVEVDLQIGGYKVALQEVEYQAGFPSYGPTHAIEGNGGPGLGGNDFQLEWSAGTLAPFGFIYTLDEYRFPDLPGASIGYFTQSFARFELRRVEAVPVPPTSVLFLLGLLLLKVRRKTPALN